jgi:hypothetical protein
MKKVILLSLFIVFGISVMNAQKSQIKNNPVGEWKFDAPYAPAGYTSGSIIVAFQEKKYSLSMAFTGFESKFEGENVKIEKDSLSFTIFIENENVSVKLKVENDTLISGKASYSEGDVPLTLTKNIASVANVKK